VAGFCDKGPETLDADQTVSPLGGNPDPDRSSSGSPMRLVAFFLLSEERRAAGDESFVPSLPGVTSRGC